jgi:hypothetical protein
MTESENDMLIYRIRDINFVFKFEKDRVMRRLDKKNN